MAGPSGPLFDHMPFGDDHGRAGEAKSFRDLCQTCRESERRHKESVELDVPAKASSRRVWGLNQGQRMLRSGAYFKSRMHP